MPSKLQTAISMNFLLVDNDQRLVSFVKRGLEAEGNHVDVALNGKEGLLYGRNLYTMIIFGLLLPGMNGTEVYRTLRKDKIQPPILMLTARDGLKDKGEGLQTGANDDLTKPFALEELLRGSRRSHAVALTKTFPQHSTYKTFA